MTDGESPRPDAAGRPPVALTVAGSDSGGGAGIQADLKTFQAFGVFGTSALTAVTAQNTRGVADVQLIRPALVARQVEVVMEDLRPDACKSGMLGDAGIIEAVAESLERPGTPPYVLDPVMVAQSGDPLLAEEAVDVLRDRLVPLADVVTPNLHEAEMLTGRAVRDAGGMREAAERIAGMGADAVLLKGGHLEGDRVVDFLYREGGWREWSGPRLETPHTHGTGCTLSSAVAAGLALGWELEEAVGNGLHFTRQALATAPRLGHGNGPLNHWTDPRRP